MPSSLPVMSIKPGDGVDTALARLILEEGALPLATLQVSLEEVRRQRERDPQASLARLLVERRLIDGATLEAAMARLAQDPTLLNATLPGAPPATAADGSSSRTLGPYRLVRELARGGMGAVHEAVHETTGARCALKTLLGLVGGPGSEEFERFRREAEAMARLHHPHVARIHAADLDGATPYIVQDLLTGGTLHDRIRAGPLALDEAVEITTKLARALAHCHAHGILHRDLKPRNVLFDEHGEPQLVDFGLALPLEEHERLTATGTLMGTPAYMAPEQAGATGEVDARTDVYGLGGLLYAMLTGRAPFTGGGIIQVLNQVLAKVPERPGKLRADVPAHLDRVCLEALAKDPSKRFPDMEAFADALQRPDQAKGGAPPWVAIAIGALLLLGIILGLSFGAAPEDPSLGEKVPRATPPGDSDPETLPPWWRELDLKPRPSLPLPAGLGFGERAGEYVNERDGSLLVYIPPGTFVMGRERRPVEIEKGYFIGKVEVTVAAYARFCQATERKLPPQFRCEGALDPNRNIPQVSISWDDAEAYCGWAGLRLPTEGEWEYAACGRDGRKWPWGNEADASRANTQGQTTDPFPGLAPVGSFPRGASPFGCLDMCANAAEWAGGGTPEKRRFLGGHWSRSLRMSTTYGRGKGTRAGNKPSEFHGFRVARGHR